MKRALVLGKGKSGRAAKALLEKKNFDVTIINTGEEKPEGPFEFVVISPGIDPRQSFVQEVRAGIALISEIECALKFSSCKLIGVTGTNGKSSLCTFLAKMFSAPVCGNIGTCASEILPALSEDQWAVVELSSYQLELMYSQKFDVGVILEITPDHLDRHKTFEAYVSAKMRLKNLVKDDGHFYQVKKKDDSKSEFFPKPVMEILEKIQKEVGGDLEKAKEEFKPLAHRIEFTGEKNGCKFYNDSKSTTPESTVYAVNRVGGSIILLVGGRDKNSDFSSWKNELKGKVKAVICFGEAREKIKKSLQGNFDLFTVNKMEEAILKSLSLAQENDNILLSPGCTSFDEFENFEQRGDVFKREVLK